MKRLDGKPRVFNKTKGRVKFLDKAHKVHSDRYTYFDDYVDCKQKIKIECKIHGIFYQTPDAHVQGKGCSLCARKGKTECFKLECKEEIFNYVKGVMNEKY